MNGKLQNPITIKTGVLQPAVRKGRRTKGNRLYEVVVKMTPRGGEEISPYQLVGHIVPQNGNHVQTLLGKISETDPCAQRMLRILRAKEGLYQQKTMRLKKATENRPGQGN